MLVKILRCPKNEIGREPEYDEDCAGADISRGIVVISDGAGSGSYASQWSCALVEHAKASPLRSASQTEVGWWLRGARAIYEKLVPAVSVDHLPPHLRNTARRGAYATLHQLRYLRSDEGSLWVQSLSIGDSCVFLLRNGSNALEMHPRKAAEDFDQAPQLVTSSADEFNPYVRTLEEGSFSDLRSGDVLMMATDAVARWLVMNGFQIDLVQPLLEIADDHGWSEWVVRQREALNINNDDSTLVIMTIEQDDATNAAFQLQLEDLVRLRELEKALTENDSFSIAEAWGDGSAIPANEHAAMLSQVEPHLRTYEAVQRMRVVLNAYHRESGSIDAVAREWQRWQKDLVLSQAGAGIRSAMEEIGISIDIRREQDR
jgi:hypothetical protein